MGTRPIPSQRHALDPNATYLSRTPHIRPERHTLGPARDVPAPPRRVALRSGPFGWMVSIVGCVGTLHGVFIWLTASGRFQHCTSLKLLPHCQPDGPKAETLPTIPSVQRSKAPPPMSRRPVGTLREHDGRGFGVVPKPLAANHPSSLRHCSPPFIMMRTSFAGCRLRSLFTCSVVLPGRRAQIHIPNDLATIIAAMTFSSQRRVNASSW